MTSIYVEKHGRFSSQTCQARDVVTPILQKIPGNLEILYQSDVGAQMILFVIFDELWISFRGTQFRNTESLIKDLLIDFKIRFSMIKKDNFMKSFEE